MNLQLDLIEDKVELFEARDLPSLEKKMNERIEINKSILLKVHSASHQMHVDQNGATFYTALVHFKNNKA
ncbi:DUF2536 family protein [Neobacillus sp. D3-1R]|uniref:DUF2536 family protein n=1 Tax=Neobacillus sp. D3-1R TaxID=3445778 RepID=UPI003F9FBF85